MVDDASRLPARDAPARAAATTPAARAVEVRAYGRLHLGFLDLAGGLGRRFGSLGLALDRPATRLIARVAEAGEAQGAEAARAARYGARAVERFGGPHLAIRVAEAIPSHAGLGSGTQLALAVAAAQARLAGRDFVAAEAAEALGRGQRSGVGAGAFETGGALLDGGRGPEGGPPPILSRMAFPDDWRVILVFDRAKVGVHGDREARAFAQLPPFPDETAGALCRLMLLQALPALAERDLTRFGGAVTELQARVGDHFAPVQGGRFASPRVAAALEALAAEGLSGYGQSSWGPTGFAFVETQAEAERLVAQLRARFAEETDLAFAIARGRNRGAELRDLAAEEAPRAA